MFVEGGGATVSGFLGGRASRSSADRDRAAHHRQRPARHSRSRTREDRRLLAPAAPGFRDGRRRAVRLRSAGAGAGRRQRRAAPRLYDGRAARSMCPTVSVERPCSRCSRRRPRQAVSVACSFFGAICRPRRANRPGAAPAARVARDPCASRWYARALCNRARGTTARTAVPPRVRARGQSPCPTLVGVHEREHPHVAGLLRRPDGAPVVGQSK